MTAPYDAVVIGGGTNGLTAASYLAAAGRRVLVVEARDSLGGMCEARTLGEGFVVSRASQTLYALDPRVVGELRLSRHGLRYAVRDMPLVGLRHDGRHIVLSRDEATTRHQIAIHSDADAHAWPRFRREHYALARRLRQIWWRSGANRKPDRALAKKLEQLSRLGAGPYLDGWFESDAVKAALAFDTQSLSPLASGSALLLLWRAAQEMCGLQGAVAVPKGGMKSLAEALADSARSRGAAVRTGCHVADIEIDRDRRAVKAVVLEDGERVAAPLVLSSLSRLRSLSFPSVFAALGIAEIAELRRHPAGVAMARVALAFDMPPIIAGSPVPMHGRFVVAERWDALAGAHAQSYAGHLPSELTLEVTFPTVTEPALAPPGKSVLSVLAGPLPLQPAEGWEQAKAMLAAQIVAILGHHLPGLSDHVAAAEILTPRDIREEFGADDAFGGAVDADRLLSDWRSRIRTPIGGLLLCGASVEPVGALSGRGGRIGAGLVLEGSDV